MRYAFWVCQKNSKSALKIENIYISNFYWEYLLCPQSSASSSFLQKCINFAEQLRFSHFEGRIIPQNKLDNLLKSGEAHPEPRQTSKMEYTVKAFAANCFHYENK